MTVHEVTYVPGARGGGCSCGLWRCYAVSGREFEILAQRHLARAALRERRPTPQRVESAFERTLREIEDLPMAWTIDLPTGHPDA